MSKGLYSINVYRNSPLNMEITTNFIFGNFQSMSCLVQYSVQTNYYGILYEKYHGKVKHVQQTEHFYKQENM